MTYNALADGLSHSYSFFSIGIDDEQKVQAVPSSPDVTFTETYAAALAVSSFVVEQGIAERSFIQYLDVDFNQTTLSSSALQTVATALDSAGTADSAYVQILWYGEGIPPPAHPVAVSTSSAQAPRRR